MKRVAMLSLSGALCALLSAIPISAAGKAADTSGKTAPMHSTPMKRSGWPAETLSGKICTVDLAQQLVVVDDSNGVPFDMKITPRTHIESGDQSLSVQDLSQYQNKSVSIRFVPERKGDVAESIRIGS